MLVAHRGFRNSWRENRLIDFQDALNIAPAVEFDIRLTKDKKIIIFHDHNFVRIGKVNEKVKNLTYEEIKQLPFFVKNTNWTPTLLDDFKNIIGDRYEFINIEIKPDYYSVSDYEIIINQIRKFKNLKAEIVVSSFSKRDQEVILTLEPRFKKGYLFEKLSHFDEKFAQNFDYLHPPVSLINRKKNVDYFKKLNKLMNPWTYKLDAQAQKSYRLYGKLIYGYISDKSDLKIL